MEKQITPSGCNFDLELQLGILMDRIRATAGLLKLSLETHGEGGAVPPEFREQVYTLIDSLHHTAERGDAITAEIVSHG
jgi:hypothetical protein